METPPNWTKKEIAPARRLNTVSPPPEERAAKRLAHPLVAWEGKKLGRTSLVMAMMAPAIMASALE